MRAIDQLMFMNLLEQNGFDNTQQFYSDAVGALNNHLESNKSNANVNANTTGIPPENNVNNTSVSSSPTTKSIDEFYQQHTREWIKGENEKAPEISMPNLPYEDRDYEKLRNVMEGGGEISGVGELYKTPQVIQGRARANAYSDMLNKALQKKNPKVFKEIENIKNSNMSATDKNKMAAQVADEHPDFYLSTEEQKQALGEHYDDFKELLPVYSSDFSKNVYGGEAGQYSTTGEYEDPLDYKSTKWGARSAVAIDPVALKYRVSNEPHKYSDRYSEKHINMGLEYDPKTKKYIPNVNVKVKDTVTGEEVPYDENKYGSGKHTEFTKEVAIKKIKEAEKEYQKQHPEKFAPSKYRDIIKHGFSVGKEINPEYTEWHKKYGGKDNESKK